MSETNMFVSSRSAFDMLWPLTWEKPQVSEKTNKLINKDQCFFFKVHNQPDTPQEVWGDSADCSITSLSPAWQSERVTAHPLLPLFPPKVEHLIWVTSRRTELHVLLWAAEMETLTKCLESTTDTHAALSLWPKRSDSALGGTSVIWRGMCQVLGVSITQQHSSSFQNISSPRWAADGRRPHFCTATRWLAAASPGFYTGAAATSCSELQWWQLLTVARHWTGW